MDLQSLFQNLLFYWRELSSIGIIGLIVFIYMNKPKTSNERVDIEYIDDSTAYKWIEKTYDINWGPIPLLNKLYICRTVDYANIEIFCSPIGSFINKLTPNCYEIKTRNKYKVIKLVNKRYFQENDINTIQISMNYPISKIYRDNINTEIVSNILLIKNENRIIIKNYIYVLSNLDYLEHIARQHNLVDLLILESTTPNFINIYEQRISELTMDLVKFKAYINEIPSKSAGEDIQLSIPLN